MEIVLITALVFVVYAKTINYSVIVDDIKWYDYIKNGGATVTKWTDWFTVVRQRLYGGATFGINTAIDHTFTVALFALACSLIYVAFGSNQISLCAALLFAVNAMNNQVSIWLNGRRYLINIILVLSMLCLGSWGLPFYFLTPMFQVTAVFSPILLFNQSPLFLLAIPVVLLLGYRQIKTKIDLRLKTIPDQDRREFSPERLIIIVKYYGHYFFKMIFPGTCLMVYQRLSRWGITQEGNEDAYSFNRDFYQGILAIVLSVLLVVILPNEYKAMAIFMSIATLQWCAIIPVTQDLADRYASLPNVFMMFFVSYIAHTYLANPGALLALIGGYYLAELYKVTPMYRDMKAYWSHQRFYNPSTVVPRRFEINWYMKRGDLMKAWMITREGLELNDKDFHFLVQAAVCHRGIGDFGLARKFAEKASRNYYLYEKATQEPQLTAFLKTLEPITKPAGSTSPDRMKKRAERMDRMATV